MNFGSKFNRVRQQADRLFLRGDRTDVVGELRYAEEQADELRILCEAFSRSLEKSLNTHLVTEEKKHRKVPENQIAETLREALKEVSQNTTEEYNERPLFKTTIEGIVGAEQFLGKEAIDHEDVVESEILVPIYKLLKEDFPLVAKQKKALKQAGQDLDAAKARVKNYHASISQPTKLENYKEELDEAESRLEQIRDSYACDLFSVLGKQREVTRLASLYLERKADHFQKALKGLNEILPSVRKTFEESSCSPVYGVPLYEHLRITQQEISVPIQICVRRMIEFGMQEEGLLRMTGSSTKIKRLKGLFDAGLITVDTTLEDYNRDYDIHVIAGAFKGYLRELPEPLLTHTKHDELVEAVRKQDHKEKLRRMWQVVNALPMQNYNNLQYVVKFLSMLASYSSDNKMTPNNIAIVMAPNLIGTQRENDNEIIEMGRNMTLGGDYRIVVEQLVEYCDYFFKAEVDFGVQPRKPEPPPSPRLRTASTANGTQFIRTGSHRRTGSTDFNITGSQTSVHPESESPKQPHRMKKKPAPLPPQGKGGWLDESGQAYPPSNSPEPTRSKTPPSNAVFNNNNTTFLFNNPTPSPAPRLHHTNSIRRPTGEPPKPPLGTVVASVKPPRPSPPAQVVESQPDTKDIKPPRPSPPNIKDVKPVNAAVEATTSFAGPIGFENLELRNPTDGDSDSPSAINKVIEPASNGPSKEEETEKPTPVIGFHIEGSSTSVKDKIKENEMIQEQVNNEATPKPIIDIELRKSNGGGVTDVEFKKSLEGVLKQQPQAHSRHLVRHSFVMEVSSGAPLPEMKAVQLPVFPVPALRSSKDPSAIERPEPAPRSDKPAVPEKPTAINRVGAADHRPLIHERPVVLGAKGASLSSSPTPTQGLSRSNEKLVEAGVEQGTSVTKSEAAPKYDVGSMERPSKPPKPCSVVQAVQESASKSGSSPHPPSTLLDEAKETTTLCPKESRTDSASSVSSLKSDSTNL